MPADMHMHQPLLLLHSDWQHMLPNTVSRLLQSRCNRNENGSIICNLQVYIQLCQRLSLDCCIGVILN